MIVNGNKSFIGSGLPNMSNTIVGWFQNVQFGIVTKTIVDYEQVETITKVNTKGVVQPATFETLELLSEGDRTWDVQEIHCLPDLQLKNGEFLYWNDTKYKVLKRENFKPYGYMHYIVREAFNNE